MIFPCPKPAPREKRPRPLQRKARINPRNDERAAEAFRTQYGSSAYVAWVHSLGCVVGGCNRSDIQAAHVVKRSRGAASSWQDIVPLCSVHHSQQEGRTAEFEKRHGLNLASLAAATAQRWMASPSRA